MKYVIAKGRLTTSTHIERTLTLKLHFLTVYEEINHNTGEISYFMNIYVSENAFDLYLIEKEQYEELQLNLLALNNIKRRNEA